MRLYHLPNPLWHTSASYPLYGSYDSVPIFHNNITFILQAEIPHIIIPYIDDVPIKGPATMYQKVNDSYETIREKPGIHQFVWENFENVKGCSEDEVLWWNVFQS
jgi:hypothetical protein